MVRKGKAGRGWAQQVKPTYSCGSVSPDTTKQAESIELTTIIYSLPFKQAWE